MRIISSSFYDLKEIETQLISPVPPERYLAHTLLGITIFLEAENQGIEGQLGVGWVIKNRMTKLKKTCHQIVLRRLQFSCWNDKEYALNRIKEGNQKIFDQCMWLADGILRNIFVDDITKNADHYFNFRIVRPIWYRKYPEKVTVDIKDHRFMKLIN